MQENTLKEMKQNKYSSQSPPQMLRHSETKPMSPEAVSFLGTFVYVLQSGYLEHLKRIVISS